MKVKESENFMEMDLNDQEEKKEQARRYKMTAGHRKILGKIYSGLRNINQKVGNKAIQKLLEEIEPDINIGQTDSSVTTEDLHLMITSDEQLMDIDYPMFFCNTESEYQFIDRPMDSETTSSVQEVSAQSEPTVSEMMF